MKQPFIYQIGRCDEFRDATDTLSHYGVKGQKWGIIRTPKQLGHETNVDSPQMTSEWAKK